MAILTLCAVARAVRHGKRERNTPLQTHLQPSLCLLALLTRRFHAGSSCPSPAIFGGLARCRPFSVCPRITSLVRQLIPWCSVASWASLMPPCCILTSFEFFGASLAWLALCLEVLQWEAPGNGLFMRDTQLNALSRC